MANPKKTIEEILAPLPGSKKEIDDYDAVHTVVAPYIDKAKDSEKRLVGEYTNAREQDEKQSATSDTTSGSSDTATTATTKKDDLEQNNLIVGKTPKLELVHMDASATREDEPNKEAEQNDDLEK